ncbi:hypothetical protein NP233_g12781 [Leucocoprinus birnbaumii]|uniref:Uncharacterized protein n=1 Tax=Leucocoprinus birnbaumii TaxID=56174 RepID=A0AAD5VJG4_9AGAR|nr:hypothetical protein NP233_g12781 [Leucocoprinus birnbaumii]
MPAKYSHVKKRSASGLLKKNGQGTTQAVKDIHLPTNHGHNHHSHSHSFTHGHGHGHHKLNPLVDRSLSKAMNTVAQLEPKISELEHAIARILLIRYDNDIARLFSTHLYTLSLVQLPTFVMRCLSLGGPSWLAWNYNSEEIKDFFRAVISMDMRQAGERVATKSVLWSYTALRQFVRFPALAADHNGLTQPSTVYIVLGNDEQCSDLRQAWTTLPPPPPILLLSKSASRYTRDSPRPHVLQTAPLRLSARGPICTRGCLRTQVWAYQRHARSPRMGRVE